MFEPTFEFNKKKLDVEMAGNWENLYALKEQDSYKILLRQIELAYQYATLDAAAATTHEAFKVQQGRMSAFMDVLSAVEMNFSSCELKQRTKGEESTPSISMVGHRSRSSAKISF